MAITALELKAVVTADTKAAEEGLRNVRKEADNASGKGGGGGLGGLISTIAGVAGGIGVFSAVSGGVSFLADQVKESITAAQNYQLVQAQTNAVLKSTGDASGQTADGIQKLAEQLSTVTPFSRDATQSAENMLLTFTNIKGNLPDVTKTTLDFATAMHTDATGAALQLGKALNDPATGYTKLQREGVTFTAAQVDSIKAMEKSGNMAGAQGVMLQELQKEFGGSAEAAGKTFGGAMQILSNKLEDTKEKIGAALIPVLSALMTALQPLMAGFTSFVSGALGGLAGFLTGTLIPAFNQWFPVLQMVMLAVQSLAGVFISALKPAFEQIVGSLGKLQGPGLSAQSILGDINKVALQMVPFVHQAGVVVGQVADLIITKVVPAYLQFYSTIAASVLPALEQLGKFIIGQVLPVVMQLVGFFVAHVLPVFMQVEEVIVANVVPALMQIVNAIITDVWPSVKQLIDSLEKLWEKLSPVLIPVLQFLGAILQNVIAPIISHTVIPAIGLLVTGLGGIVTVLTDIISWIQSAVTWFGNLGGAVASALKGIVTGPIGGVLHVLHIPGFADGTPSAPGGLAMVGERGPELVNLPRGSSVTPLPSGLSGGGSASTSASGGPMIVRLVVDGRTLAEIVTKYQPGVIRQATGSRGF